jgi:hypothetical protein
LAEERHHLGFAIFNITAKNAIKKCQKLATKKNESMNRGLMRCFKIPTSHLDLFLVACDLNFNDIRPEYIFQYEGRYEVVFLDKIPPFMQEKIEKFIGETLGAGFCNRFNTARTSRPSSKGRFPSGRD